MTTISEKKPAINRPEELDEEQSQKNNEESGTPKTVDFSKVFKTTMAQMSSNIRKQPNKRTKREEEFSEEDEEEDSSEEEFSEEDEDSESEEDIRWAAINKLLESHLKITETILTIVKETKNE
jgi:hypothetical protein